MFYLYSPVQYLNMVSCQILRACINITYRSFVLTTLSRQADIIYNILREYFSQAAAFSSGNVSLYTQNGPKKYVTWILSNNNVKCLKFKVNLFSGVTRLGVTWGGKWCKMMTFFSCPISFVQCSF